MRELIRPALLIVSRTGLFLAVGGWIAGQWWQVYAGVPGRFRAEVNNLGWAATHSRFQPDNELFVRTNYGQERQIPRSLFTHSEQRTVGFRGLVFGHHAQLHWVSVRHWFVLTLLTFFNMLLYLSRHRSPEV